MGQDSKLKQETCKLGHNVFWTMDSDIACQPMLFAIISKRNFNFVPQAHNLYQNDSLVSSALSGASKFPEKHIYHLAETQIFDLDLEMTL